MNAKAIDIGTIELSDKVFISDPCYNTDTWCTVRISNVIPGTYHCRIRTKTDYYRNKRVKELIAIHESALNLKSRLEWEYAGNAGVDSGQMGIYDYSHFDKLNETEKIKDSWYDKVCQITSKDDVNTAGIADKHSAVCSSGYGDSSYPVYCSWTKDKLRAIKVVFI